MGRAAAAAAALLQAGGRSLWLGVAGLLRWHICPPRPGLSARQTRHAHPTTPQVSLSRTCAYRGVTLGGGEAASGGSAAKAAREAGVVHWAMGEGKAVRLGWSLACTVPVNATSRAREPDGAPFDPFSV